MPCLYRCSFIAAIAAIFTVLLVGTVLPAPSTFSYVAGRIKRTFDLALPNLPPSVQAHYAVRMYRATGDSIYVSFALSDCAVVVRELRTDLDSVGDPSYCSRRSDGLLDSLIGDNRKTRVRRALFSDRSRVRVDLEILHNASKLADYSLSDSVSLLVATRAKDYLRKVDFAAFLCDTQVIRIYSAQAVNFIYYLCSLGLGDLTAQYRQAFLQAFPDKHDDDLSDLQFTDKIYGMTHFVLAASDYYQHAVDSAAFDWILTYFERERNRILWDTKPDVIAEVGICYLLAGKAEHPMVHRCRDAVAKAFDKKVGMIPAPSGSADQTQGEHRNVLAFLLLQWPSQLRAGPHFAGPCSADSIQSTLDLMQRRHLGTLANR